MLSKQSHHGKRLWLHINTSSQPCDACSNWLQSAKAACINLFHPVNIDHILECSGLYRNAQLDGFVDCANLDRR